MKLDPEQQRAVESTGSVAVIAGPGSGKTRVLVEKAKYESELDSKKLIALTFTRNAAEELKQRAPLVESHTIHSFCYRTLGRFPGTYEGLLDEFLLLVRKPKFDLVLVDECMDLSPQETRVILSISKGRVFFVGDNNQAIFGYADGEGQQIFKTSIKKMYLTRNYRSSQNVVSKLNRINPKGLTSVYANGNPKITGTAILCRTNLQLDAVAFALKEMDYSFTIKKRGVEFPGEVIGSKESSLMLCTIHVAKGKEWNKVLCFDWGERNLEKNLYYVAISRAAKEFHLVNSISECVELLQ